MSDHPTDRYIAEKEGYLPRLIESSQIARDLVRSGWTVVRVVKVEPMDGPS